MSLLNALHATTARARQVRMRRRRWARPVEGMYGELSDLRQRSATASSKASSRCDRCRLPFVKRLRKTRVAFELRLRITVDPSTHRTCGHVRRSCNARVGLWLDGSGQNNNRPKSAFVENRYIGNLCIFKKPDISRLVRTSCRKRLGEC